MFVTKRNGKIESVQFDKITERISKLVNSNERKFVDPILIAQKTVASIFNGITTEELDLESAKICVNLCTTHYLYSTIASRIVISNLHKKTINSFVEKENIIQKELNLLDINWLKWINENKNEIDNMIDYSRDYIYDYFGFKTLERAYLIKNGNNIIERPQDMIMRVSSFINNGDLELTKKTYDILSLGFYTHASPTLFNAGNKRSQLSSCFLLGTDDTLEGITKTWADVSKISKWGGGIGIHISNIRAKGTLIKGTNGPSSGIIPMLKVYNEIARYIDQCFIGSTKIYTENGLIPIEKIKPTNKVFTNDGTLQNVKRVYCDNYKGKILNLKIMNDYENICVTPSHPFFVVKNYNCDNDFDIIKNKLVNKIIVPEWIDASNITKHDFIGFPIPQYFVDNNEIDESDCYMYSLMLNNGLICKNNVEIKFSLDKEYCIDFTRKYLNQNGIIFSEIKTLDTYNFEWIITSKFRFVRSQIYDNEEKYIDSVFLNLPENKVKYILKGLLDTNCSMTKDKILYESTTKNIIDGIKYILLKMGILCSGNTKVLEIPKTNKIIELLYINKYSKFDNIMYFEYDNILYTRIENISEEEINDNVYDLEIENNHNYLTQAGLVHNGGKRKGSIAFYIEPHHADIKAFLDLRKNAGVETERARDLFTALWISDLFMKQVESDGDWYLMCPDICPGLTNVYGDDYENLYYSYVKQNKYNEKVKARSIWQLIMESQIETGTPYITFKDSVNHKSNQKNVGVIKSSNLCVHEDTLILTSNGYKTIKSLKDQETEVWNGDEWSKVVIKQTGTNQNLIRIYFSNGCYLDCTPEHKFYIQNNFNEIVSAKDLQMTDKLIEFKLPHPLEIKNPENFLYPYTHGVICSYQDSIICSYQDSIICDNNIDNNKLYLNKEKKKLLNYIDYESYTENIEYNILEVELPKNINQKYKVPINASIDNKLRWFEGLCDSNGEISITGINELLSIKNTNKEFLLNIKLMLQTLGIESYVKIYINRLIIELEQIYKLLPLGFSPKILKFDVKPQPNSIQNIKVTFISESYQNVDTYCFTEPLKHKGIFNGILTGQCNEIVEYSDEKEYAVCNLASIAINKFVEPFIYNDEDKWIIYSKENCKYCDYAKIFFKNKEIKYSEIKNELPEFAKTYPQIYHNDNYIGGYDELFDYIKGTFNYDKLYETAYLAAINLNKIIDINYYPVPETQVSNMRHRPIGLGIQGLADTLVLLKIPYDSDESVEFNKKMMETIYLASITASNDLAKKIYENQNDKLDTLCGAYSTFKGSPSSEGKFQFDLWNYDRNKLNYKDKWEILTENVKKYGLQNSLVTALMPTASTSQILGNNECFEFFTNNIYTRRTLAGDFPLVNKYLIDELINLNLWSNEMKQMIIANNGSINIFNEIPSKIKRLFQTIWEIKQIWTLKNAVARGPFVDQTQSMNIFMALPDFQKLHSCHFWAWKNGLKTGIYYLRSKPAKEATKVTIDNTILKKIKDLNEENDACINCSA
jgi:ribonucleoside-diphosphate reductase alpha chain